jgi:hypothetical protein
LLLALLAASFCNAASDAARCATGLAAGCVSA